MKHIIIWVIVTIFILAITGLASAQSITLAFVGDEGSFLDHNKAALQWAQKAFNAKLIAPEDLAKEDLTRYAVVWWHDGDTDPTALIAGSVKKALNDYIQAGGAVLLSAAAEKLATELGIESGTPRIYGPGNDAQLAGLTIREDTVEHPVWEGFKRDAGEKIEVTSLGYPKSSDYWSRTYIDAITIGNCWETGSDWTDEVGAFVEWTKNTGKGIVFGMGWRLPHWTTDNKDRPVLEQITTNVIKYLAGKSLFFAVSPSGIIATRWAYLKVE